MAEAKKDERTVATKVTGAEWSKLALMATAEGQKSVGGYMHLLIERALEDKQTIAKVKAYFHIEDDAKAPAKAATKAASPTAK